MGDLVPPDPPLAGVQVALRPFRVGDAAAILESCRPWAESVGVQAPTGPELVV
jgi:hypothetical protein